MSFGIAEICIFECALYKLVSTLAILICVGVNKKNFSVIIGLAIGLGVSVVTSSAEPIGNIAILALVANIFSYPHKYKICVTTLLGLLIREIYFNGLNNELMYSIIPVAFACVIFLCIPNKVIDKIADKYLTSNAELSVRNVIISTRKNIQQRMGGLSDIFEQMQQMYLKLISQELGLEQAVSLLGQEISESLCTECKHKNSCYKGLGDANMQRD